MSVLTLIENWEGDFKKTSYETLSYARNVTNQLNTDLIVLTLGSTQPKQLIEYGADKVINISNLKFETTTNKVISDLCVEIIQEYEINTTIIANTNVGKSISPLITVKLKDTGLITNAIALPEKTAPLTVKCKAFSSKAYVKYESNYNSNIINILPNSIGNINKTPGKGEIINIEKSFEDSIQILDRKKSNEKISLSDAEIVVSAGRGLKAPENWEMIEELAELLGAATACSKPVSDMGWRPHSEHVGQTGLVVNPELYIAIGISGAIQHLAGVNGSKNIVVINIDADAPFFKGANYGIIGDAFVIIPKLIEAIKNHKN